jgi:macrolide-specific efflux system membrane fusion protein
MQVSKRAIINTSLGIVVVAAIIGAYFVINPPPASTAGTQTQLTSTVQQGTVSNTITATGAVSPGREATASFAVSGTIATVPVALGQSVAAGDVLGTLDPSALQRTVNEDQTQVNNAIANLSYSRSDLATAITANVQDPTKSTTNAKSAVLNAQAQVSSASDALATAKSNVASTTLTAPISGVVIAVNGTVGGSSSGGSSSSASASSSSTSSSGFVTIADVSAMTVTANIAEADIASVTVGQVAKVTFPAVAGLSADAKVTAIAPTATSSNSIVTYATTVTLGTIPQGLRLGQTASVAITTKSSAATALSVPSAAIKTANGISTVEVVDSADPTKTATVTVKLGIVGNTGTEIVSGLKLGETVVLGTVSANASTTGTTGIGGFGGGSLRGGTGGFRGGTGSSGGGSGGSTVRGSNG